MKTRRFTVVAFLLAAVMIIGIGFANLTDNLFIKGEAALSTTDARNAFDEDVYFIGENNKPDGYTGDVTGLHTNAEEGIDTNAVGATDNDSATFKVASLGIKDDWVMFKYVVRNDSEEFDAVISLDEGYPQTSGTNATCFKIEYTDENGAVTNQSVTCAAGGTAVLYVKVTLTATPETNLTAAFNVNLTATSTPKA